MTNSDATTAGRGGGLTEDPRVPNEETAVRVTPDRCMLTTLVAGYEIDRMTVDPALDRRVFIFLVVVESVASDHR